MATLADIRTKIRRITRSPSVSQLTDADIDQYVNDFLLYDMPEHLRLFTFRREFVFYASPNIDVYATNTIDAASPMYDFKNAYITSHDPVYVGGAQVYFTQSRSDFYSLWPQLQQKLQIGTGDGVTVNFTGTLSTIPILSFNVLFNTIDTAGDGMALYDKAGDGDLYGDVGAASTINYVTGVYDITFTNAPDTGQPIYAQVVGYAPSRPSAVLYFNNTFFLRPVPDMAYKVSIETYIRPTALANDGDIPELEQHWQYISYGASLKIFQDRMDLDSAQSIMPEFKQQELLVGRRTIVQQSNERVATIYSQTFNPFYGSGWNNRPY